MNHTPIILLASERSGTNLLRAILCSHSAIASPPPSGMLDVLPNLIGRYLPVDGGGHVAELIEDSITLAKTHMNPWDVELTQEQLLGRMDGPGLWGLFRAMNDAYADAKGRSHWLSKEPGLFRHIYEIALHYPDAKFIYLVRDGRDVAASMLKGGLHARDIQHAAERWSNEQNSCSAALADPLVKPRCVMLKYEDLIRDPHDVVPELMGFLGLAFEKQQLEYYAQKDIQKHANSSAFWRELSEPIKSNNFGKYRTLLSARQIEIFESVAQRQLEAFGYSLEHDKPKPISGMEKLIGRIFLPFKRKKHDFMESEELEKRTRRTTALRNIAQRQFCNS